MNNLYRELAPVTESAWEQIGGAARTFKRHIAAVAAWSTWAVRADR